ncbi:hypothetical protein SAMN04488134_105157 [Amphibacillus marinus]|uniref:Uncharacterized protein n=1 Tax=Amphibacillus marinus TaxID=872970 RepID=A0A1H8N7P5_9BACI|nr:hypothetical protein [Amphibacillus marinus]SEO25635.1 hypothetical protein SAMN04488134_105157 [Amphibacillus marinus]
MWVIIISKKFMILLTILFIMGIGVIVPLIISNQSGAQPAATQLQINELSVVFNYQMKAASIRDKSVSMNVINKTDEVDDEPLEHDVVMLEEDSDSVEVTVTLPSNIRNGRSTNTTNNQPPIQATRRSNNQSTNKNTDQKDEQVKEKEATTDEKEEPPKVEKPKNEAPKPTPKPNPDNKPETGGSDEDVSHHDDEEDEKKPDPNENSEADEDQPVTDDPGSNHSDD